MSEQRRTIGLIGDAAAGKDWIAEQIVARGFVAVSGSDILREEIARRRLTTSRELQTTIANEMRAQHGGAYFAIAALTKATRIARAHEGIIISGIYSVSEGRYLRENAAATLIHVVASQEDDLRTRFSRLQSRADGARDTLSYEAFVAAHTRENSGQTPEMANVADLAALADLTLVNDGNNPRIEMELNQLFGSKL